MRSTARVARASLPAARRAARDVVRRWGRSANEQTQRSVVRTLLRAFGQGVRIDRPKQRAATGVNHRDDDLGAAWRVEHEPIEFRDAVRHRHKVAWRCRVHVTSLRDGGTGRGARPPERRRPGPPGLGGTHGPMHRPTAPIESDYGARSSVFSMVDPLESAPRTTNSSIDWGRWRRRGASRCSSRSSDGQWARPAASGLLS